MHDSNHRDDFEEYLRNEVGNHRMYPSDRVWQNIRGKVNTPKKWPALSVFTIVIISGLIIGTILNKPVPDSIAPNFAFSSIQRNTTQSDLSATDNTAAEVKDARQLAENNYSVQQLTSRTINSVVEKIRIDNAIALQFAAIEQQLPSVGSNLGMPPTVQAANTLSAVSETPAATFVKTAAVSKNTFTAANADDKRVNSAITFRNIDNYFFDVTSRLRSIFNTEPLHTSKSSAAFFISGKNDLSYTGFDIRIPSKHKDINILPSLKNLGKSSSRFDFRFYITPSVSYRRLKEDDQSAKQTTASSSLESDFRIDPSVAINHTPALGYETGVGLGYKLNDKLTLTGGFQFNISQYKINAFSYKDEPAVVTLDEGAYASNVSTVSSLRSVSGNKPLTIKNRYFQLSMPVGLEWSILNHGKFTWGVGGSVQPTYTFDKQPLIISSNYKNYTDGSEYVRNWNINTNLETFLGYTTGSYRWQVGPQIRYQILPSLVDKYPNKEYLLNYGIKIGVVKQLK